MAEKHTEKTSPEIKDLERKRSSQGEDRLASDSESITTDSGRATSTDRTSVTTLQTSTDISGIEVKETVTASPELPLIKEQPVGLPEGSGVDSNELSPGKASLLSRAKGMASRGLQAVARSLSPKNDSSVGGGGLKSPKEASEGAASSSTQSKWSRLKQTLSPSKLRLSENVSGDGPKGLSVDATMPQNTKEGQTTPTKSFMQRCKDTLSTPKAGSSSSAPYERMDTDHASGESSKCETAKEKRSRFAEASGESYKCETAKQKRSRFAALLNLSRGNSGSQEHEKRKSLWTSERATLEHTPSDPTEELDLDYLSTPDDSAENLPVSEKPVAEQKSLAEEATEESYSQSANEENSDMHVDESKN